jgi:hypothetical protein
MNQSFHMRTLRHQEIIMQDQKPRSTFEPRANPNPAGPAYDPDADVAREPRAKAPPGEPGARAPYDPKNTSATGATQTRIPRTGTEAEAPKGDRFTRGANTFRTMQPWQIWALAIAAAVVVAFIVFVI